MKALLRHDGGCRPKNPGHAAFACVVKIDGEQHIISRYLGIKTNNEAEYIGLIVGVKYAATLGADEIEVISDSQLVVNQVSGEWYPKKPHLKILCLDARDTLEKLFPGKWKIRWEGRQNNTVADRACTKAIWWGMNLNPMLPQSIRDKKPGEQIDPFASSRQVPPSDLSKIIRTLELHKLFDELQI